jgi:hypothetical protein
MYPLLPIIITSFKTTQNYYKVRCYTIVALTPIHRLLGRGERDVVQASAERSSLVDTRSLLVSATAGNADLEAESRRDVAVRRSTAATASTGAVGLSDGRASALAGREATAALLALTVAGALGEDNLLGVLADRDGGSSRCGRCSRGGGRSGSGRGSSSATTETASLTAGSGRNETGSALADGAAGRGALAIIGTFTSDELGASGLARASSWSSGGSGASSRGSGTSGRTLTSLRVVDASRLDLAAEGDGRDVVGGDVAEPASTVTLLGDDGRGTLAGLEATA